MNRTATVVATQGQSSVDFDRHTVILATESGKYFQVDGVAARVWALIQEPRRIDEICAQVVAEYAVEPAVAEADLVDLLDQLASEGLVEEQRTPESA